MMAKALNERQMQVLRWISQGCPEGVWGDFTYKTSAQALRNRGLVSIVRRRGHWTAEVTQAGRHYLESGRYPPSSTTQSSTAKKTSSGSSSVSGADSAPSTANASNKGPAQATSAPAVHKTSKPRRATLGEQLVEDLLAAGGSLVVTQEYGVGAPNWTARIRSAQRCGKLPEGKELVHGWKAGGYEISIQDIPAWKLAVLAPIPVPDVIRKPHAVVSALRDGSPALRLSKSVQQRALRLVQAIVTEAERRGHKVQLPRAEHRRSRSRALGGGDLFTITARGQLCGFSFGQAQDRTEHVPTAKELADAERYSWVKIPAYDYSPSSRLAIALNGGIQHRRSTWTDAADRPLEDQLPEIVQEVDLRGLAAERKRAEEEEKARNKLSRWEAAMRQARLEYAEAFRIRVLQQQEHAWRQAARLDDYLAAARDRITALPDGAERSAAEQWLTWASKYVRSLDPLSRPLHLPEIPAPRHSDLEPFLHGWSPYGPYSR
ncbi:hypothetical protein [Streptomyces sp. NPDC002851]